MSMDWNTRYSDSDFVYGINANDFLVSVSEKLNIGECLTLAEGEGRNAIYLAKNNHQVTAVDASDVGLQKANLLADKNKVAINTILCDLSDYNIKENHYDSIISIFCHIPVSIRQNIHKQVVSGLKPGGLFVLEAYTAKQLQYGTGGPPNSDLMMSLKELKQELAGLEFLIAQEIDREINEGKYHNGQGAVVQILARKN